MREPGAALAAEDDFFLGNKGLSQMPRKTSPKKKSPLAAQAASGPRFGKALVPNRLGGRDIGCDVPLVQVREVQLNAYFDRALTRNRNGMMYDRDWGDAIVDQNLPNDPGPINSGNFKPVTRWIVLYRTAEAGVDGTHQITVNDVRTAITGAGTATANPFIIKEMHVWIAPNAINTHFSGLLITFDDADNGILGGQYSDIATLTELVKFRVKYRGEGYVTAGNESATKVVLAIGGSAKWNGLVYAQVETYD